MKSGWMELALGGGGRRSDREVIVGSARRRASCYEDWETVGPEASCREAHRLEGDLTVCRESGRDAGSRAGLKVWGIGNLYASCHGVPGLASDEKFIRCMDFPADPLGRVSEAKQLNDRL